MIYERNLTPVEVASNSLQIRAVDGQGKSVLIPIGLISSGSVASEYAGKAYIGTSPGVPENRVYWICMEEGQAEYTSFLDGEGNPQTARQFDRFYWNGSYWDLIPYGSNVDVRFVKVNDVIKQQYWTGTEWADTGTDQAI